jgi:hypothetical protein
MSTNTPIYTGFWTNYAKGEVTGPTLTLSNRNGAILIAALAIFIQVSASSIIKQFSSFIIPTSYVEIACWWSIMEYHMLPHTPIEDSNAPKRGVLSSATSDFTE